MSSSLLPPGSRPLTTPELNAAIAALKPERREHYRAKAAKDGCTLQEHLSRRLSKKIKHSAVATAPSPIIRPKPKAQVIDLTGSDDEKENSNPAVACAVVSSIGATDRGQWKPRKSKGLAALVSVLVL